jgi:predicted outer membrane repeat protein
LVGGEYAVASIFVVAALIVSPSPVRAAGVVNPCNQANLQTALSGGGVVTFNCGTATITLTSALTISQNTTIDGGGQGGAIYVGGAPPNNGIVPITGGTFSGNTAFNQGGAIYVHLYQNNDAVTIDAVSFLNNAVNGVTNGLGGVFSGGNGRVTILKSLFSGNVATSARSNFRRSISRPRLMSSRASMPITPPRRLCVGNLWLGRQVTKFRSTTRQVLMHHWLSRA